MSNLRQSQEKVVAAVRFLNDEARRFHLEQAVMGSKVVQLESDLTRHLGLQVYVTAEAYITACNLMEPYDLASHYAVEWDAGAAAYITSTIYTVECLVAALGTV